MLSGYNDEYYREFVINCTSSNLNLTYKWGDSEYFEANGKFKPEAKVGDYGILTGSFTHHYTTSEPVRDSEGNLVYGGSQEDGTWHIKYEKVDHYRDYTLCLFCHQYSETRWRFILFVDLYLANHVYHGKYVNSYAHSSNIDAAEIGSITHDFTADLPLNNYPTEKKKTRFAVWPFRPKAAKIPAPFFARGLG